MTHPEQIGGPATPVWWRGQDEHVQVRSVIGDGSTVIVENLVHHEVHEGHVWEVSTYNASIANAGTLILCSPVLTDVAHSTFAMACGGNATISLIEGPTPTGGANVQAHNLNRVVGDAGALTWLSQPALAGGTVIGGPLLAPGGRGPQSGGGAFALRAELEWMLNSGVRYALRLTNISGNAQPASVNVVYYFD